MYESYGLCWNAAVHETCSLSDVMHMHLQVVGCTSRTTMFAICNFNEICITCTCMCTMTKTVLNPLWREHHWMHVLVPSLTLLNYILTMGYKLECTTVLPNNVLTSWPLHSRTIHQQASLQFLGLNMPHNCTIMHLNSDVLITYRQQSPIYPVWIMI